MVRMPEILEMPSEKEVKASVAPLAGATVGIAGSTYVLESLLKAEGNLPSGWKEGAKVITLLGSGLITGGAFANTMGAKDDWERAGNGAAAGAFGITVLEVIKEVLAVLPPITIPGIGQLQPKEVRVVDRRPASQSPPQSQYRTDSMYRTDALYRTDSCMGRKYVG